MRSLPRPQRLLVPPRGRRLLQPGRPDSSCRVSPGPHLPGRQHGRQPHPVRVGCHAREVHGSHLEGQRRDQAGPKQRARTKAVIKVDIASIKTGVELRDDHLRKENWLDAPHFPNAEFVVTKVSGIDKLKPGEQAEATVKGKFRLHGVTKEVTTKARVRLVPAEPGKPGGDVLRIQTSFVIKLEDHKVSIPAIVSLKVSPDIVVNVDIRATAG